MTARSIIVAKERVPIDALVPFPGNARVHDDALLDLSVDADTGHGIFRSIVVRVGTNEILAGNGTWAAAKRRGATEIDVDYVDVDDDEALEINLIDNAANDRAKYDKGALVAQLESQYERRGNLGVTGYDTDAVKRLLPSDYAGSLLNVIGPQPAGGGDSGAPVDLDARYEVAVECDGEDDQVTKLTELRDAGYRVRAIIV